VVEEHLCATGKLAQGWIGTEEAWCLLSTVMPCAAGAKGDGGGGMWVERSELCTGTGGIERRHHRKAYARERQEVKALW
jgi:hypothetical protein